MSTRAFKQQIVDLKKKKKDMSDVHGTLNVIVFEPEMALKLLSYRAI